jgi:hypothetical protein
MEDRVAIIIPIHPPKFDWMRRIANWRSVSTTLFLVFTNEREAALFKAFNNFGLKFTPIIVTQICPQSAIDTAFGNSGIVSFKKFVALHHISEAYAYRYAICVDAEIKFVNIDKLLPACQSFCELKTIVAGTNCCPKINAACLQFFRDDPNYESIKRYESNYFWFSEIPIYDMEIVPGFFKYIGRTDDWLGIVSQMSYHTFEYVAYYFYSMLYNGYTLTVLPDHGWSLEQCSAALWKKVNETICPLHWVWEKSYDTTMDVVMLYHLDR